MKKYHRTKTALSYGVCAFRLITRTKILAPYIVLTIGQALSNENRGLSRGSPQ
ncbi:hypothetical protein [Kiloniella spongiae]|uniref:hypothetical protein n=1 Tax=Kiloniella spongiae TaxID=1489064 RepID=UPI0012E0B46E|nr:hypothetical protein [Kiloniella spongiae]